MLSLLPPPEYAGFPTIDLPRCPVPAQVGDGGNVEGMAAEFIDVAQPDYCKVPQRRTLGTHKPGQCWHLAPSSSLAPSFWLP